MTKDNGNNGNGKKQAPIQEQVTCALHHIGEIRETIASLRGMILALSDQNDERADKFAHMFQIGMVGISNAINNQIPKAIDRTERFAAEALPRLSLIANAVKQPPSPGIITSIIELTAAVRDLQDTKATHITELLSALNMIADAIPQKNVLVTDNASDKIADTIRDLITLLDERLPH